MTDPGLLALLGAGAAGAVLGAGAVALRVRTERRRRRLAERERAELDARLHTLTEHLHEAVVSYGA
ncbi:MAG TPA: hypothetical protein VFU46_05740, partial [Gemmatimonadales bacterium]|nr:hypothetical protein [Gemmatimonadales bacterium]